MPGRVVRADEPRRLDPVEQGHADIHQHDPGPVLPGEAHGLPPVGRFGDDGDAGGAIEEYAESGADQLLVVGQKHRDRGLLGRGVSHVLPSTGSAPVGWFQCRPNCPY